MSRTRPLAPYLAIFFIVLASTWGVIIAPARAERVPTASYVLIAGAAGLRWDDVSPTDTPTLWRLASHGSIGVLSVRSGRTPTCPDDGWLTMGAGNYAQARLTANRVGSQCPPLGVEIVTPDNIGASLPHQQTVVKQNRELSYGAQPGALPEAVRCTAAVGPGAAIAAARPYGRVDKYLPALPRDPAPYLSSCVLSIVDLGTIAGSDPAARRAAARAADGALARMLAARPENSLVMIAGLSDTDLTSRLHVAIADGPGFSGGWITSSTTGRPGYLQLIDLAPTTLAVLHKPAPTRLFAGKPAERTGGRPANLATAVARLADADREASAQHRVTGRFFGVLAAGQLLLMALVIPVLRRARSTRASRPGPLPGWLLRAVDLLLVAAALSIPAALVTDAVPWWRSDHAGPLFTVVMLAILALSTTAVLAVRRLRRYRWGVVGAVCAVAAGVVGVDVLTGARLQLNGVAGYSALEGSRYAGVGTVALGAFLAGVLLGAGVLAQRCPRQWRPVCVAAVGGAGVVLVGSPYLGADAGGAIALTAGTCLTAALSTGGWLTFARVAWATLAGVAITGGFTLIDLSRAPQDRGGLGAFIADTRAGTGGLAVHRAGSANVVAVLTSPLTLVVIGSAIFILFVLLRPWGGLKRLFGISPAVKAGLAGVAVAGVIGGVFDTAGLNVAGAAAATVVPLATLASVRVLRRLDLRTAVAVPPGAQGLARPPGAAPARPGPERRPEGAGPVPAPVTAAAAERATAERTTAERATAERSAVRDVAATTAGPPARTGEPGEPATTARPPAPTGEPGEPAATFDGPGEPAVRPGDPAVGPGDPAVGPGDPAVGPGDPAVRAGGPAEDGARAPDPAGPAR